MKKVICIHEKKSVCGKYTVQKDKIYTVEEEREVPCSGEPGYIIDRINGVPVVAAQMLFRDIESPPVLVTFTELVETYPVHAN